MALPRPNERIALMFPAPEGSPVANRVRWWWIVQPPPSVAFNLQGRIAAALGAAGEYAIRGLFVADEQAEDLERDTATVGEDLALRTLRRSRAGKGIAETQDSDGFTGCTARLWAVLRASAVKSGGGLDAVGLLGEPERVRGRQEVRWARSGLLYHLLLHSGLRYDGEGPAPLPPTPDGPPPRDAPADLRARVALRDAVAEGSVGAFTAALDDVLTSPDELALLCTWAVVHLWRPF